MALRGLLMGACQPCGTLQRLVTRSSVSTAAWGPHLGPLPWTRQAQRQREGRRSLSPAPRRYRDSEDEAAPAHRTLQAKDASYRELLQVRRRPAMGARGGWAALTDTPPHTSHIHTWYPVADQ